MFQLLITLNEDIYYMLRSRKDIGSVIFFNNYFKNFVFFFQTRGIYANRLHFPSVLVSSDGLIVSVVPCVTWFELRPRL